MIPIRRRLFESTGFTPRQLFAALQGAWLVPVQGSIWQENTGVTPTTTGGQTIGLLLDQSQGAVLGPELVTNGAFDSDGSPWLVGSGWALGSGVATCTANAGYGQLRQTLTGLVPGLGYRITFDMTRTVGGVQVRLGNTSNSGFSFDSSGTKQVTLIAGSVNQTLAFVAYGVYIAGDGNFTGTIDNVSVREILGNHASQSTAANRPLLGRRYNLLTYSEDFSNAAWLKNVTDIATNSTVAPDGTTTADTYTHTSTSGAYVSQTVSGSGSATYSFAFSAKSLNSQWVRVSITSRDVWFDIVNGVVGTNAGSGTLISATITPQGNGWYRITLISTQASAAITVVNVSGDGSNTRTLTSTYIWGADLRLTSDVGKDPTYQRITTATDYDYGQYPAAVHDTTDSLVVSLPSINVRRNLLTSTTGPFTNLTAGGWLYETGLPDPLGRPWATKISYGSGLGGILVPAGTATDTTLTYSVIIKHVSGLSLWSIGLRNTTTSTTFQIGTINAATGSVSGAGWASTALGNGWYRYTFTQAGGITVGNFLWFYLLTGTLGSSASWLVAWPQLEAGSVATDYQRVTDWTSEAYSSNGSVYFSTPVGMSALHNQSMGTTYTLPALSTDIYSWIVVPQRLSTVMESRLERYMLRKANLSEPDYLLDDDGNQLMSDDYELLLRQ